MDLQNSILDRIGAGEPYLDKVVAVQERAEIAGLLVVLVRVAVQATPRSPRTTRLSLQLHSGPTWSSVIRRSSRIRD